MVVVIKAESFSSYNVTVTHLVTSQKSQQILTDYTFLGEMMRKTYLYLNIDEYNPSLPLT